MRLPIVNLTFYALLPFYLSAQEVQQSDFPDQYVEKECITLDASSSTSPANKPMVYKWDFGDGNIGEGIAVDHCYVQPGVYSVTLDLFDPVSGALINREFELEIPIQPRFKLQIDTSESAGLISLSGSIIASAGDTDQPEVEYYWDVDGQYFQSNSLNIDRSGISSVRLLAYLPELDAYLSITQNFGE